MKFNFFFIVKFFIFYFLLFGTVNSQNRYDLPQKVLQGELIISQINGYADQTKVKIFKDKVPLKVSKNGYFVIPIDRDRKNNVLLEICMDQCESNEIIVLKRNFDIQEINGLPSKLVTPDEKVLERIIAENKIIKRSKKIMIDDEYFINSFVQPVEGIVTGVFGSQRILNGKAKSPHRGLDIANDEGTPVVSTNDGLVVLAESDLYYTGGTVVIDHGYGVKSIYAHLATVDVELNNTVRRNEVIGTVGSTGRSTGPHLHWGIMVFDTYIDPQLLLKKYN
ncbi:MAG: M23 family metallopeptidase [Pelagibacterales bacterium]|nr:M23 family metallopeptidase [Pelagibacterales bacterium]